MKYRILFLLLLLLPGCRSDFSEAVLTDPVRRSGRRIGAVLSVVPPADPSRTKSAFAGDPGTIADWCLFQFDAEDGILAARYYQASGADMTRISVVTGHRYDWYAVANVGDMTDSFTPGVATEAQLEAWLATGLDAERLAGAGGLPMSWHGQGIGFSAQELRDGARLSVQLVRLVSRYDLTLDRSGLASYVFTATGLTIEGPCSVQPFAASNRALSAPLSADQATSADVAAFNAGNAVTFYALENRYGNLLEGNTDCWRKKPANLPGGVFPTFVEVKGNVRDRADESAPWIPVTYRFYLGGDALQNFDVVRNTANTVTLLLSDAAVEAAVAELEAGTGGDPIWKVEAGSYSDDRALAFAHETIALPTDGTPLLEDLVKTPLDLPFVLKMDQALITAGMKVFTDAAMTDEVTPASGTASKTLPGTISGLYFVYPAHGEPVAGTVRIETLDGKKYDELHITSGRALVRLDMLVGTYSTSSTYVPIAYDFSWADPSTANAGRGTRYTAAAPLDTVLANMTNRSAVPLRFAAQFYAVYSDGSEKLLKNNEYTIGNVSVSNQGSQTVTAAATYNSAAAMFNLLEPLDGNHDKQAFCLEKTATATASVRYTEGTTTVSLPMTVTVWRGAFDVTPHTRQTETSGVGRAVLNYGESLDVQYFYHAENGQSINVSQQVFGVAGPRNDGNTANSTRLASQVYDSVNDKIVLTAISSTSDQGPFKLRYMIQNNALDMRSIFGTKCRPASVPSVVIDPATSGISTYFSNVWITVQDPRVLDHIAFEPECLYVGNTYNEVVASPAPDDAANSIWHYRLYAHYTNGTQENISSLTTAQGLSWADHGVLENLSSIWRFHTSGAPEAYDGYRAGWRFFEYGQGDDYLIAKRLDASGSGEGAYARAIFAHFDESGVEEEDLSLSGITRLPQDLWTASYTFNGVTKSAAVRAIVLQDLVPVSIEVDPSSLTVHPYGKATVSVTIVYSDGTRIPASSAPGTLTVEAHYGNASSGRYHGASHNWGNDWATYCINPSMTAGGVAVIAKGFTGSDSFSVKYVQASTTLWADVDVTVAPEPASMYPVSLTLTPKRRENVDGSADNSFVARARMSDGSIRNVSTVCNWSFENSTVAGSGFAWYASLHGQSDFSESNSVGIWGGGGGAHTDIVASYTLNGHTVSDRGYISLKASAPIDHGSVVGVELQWKLHGDSAYSAADGTVGIGDDVDIRLCSVYQDGYRDTRSWSSSGLTVTGENLISWTGSNNDRFTANATGTVTFTYTDGAMSSTLSLEITSTPTPPGPSHRLVVETSTGALDNAIRDGESVYYKAYYETLNDDAWIREGDVTAACTWSVSDEIAAYVTAVKSGSGSAARYTVMSKGTNTSQLTGFVNARYADGSGYTSIDPLRLTLLPAYYLTVDPSVLEWDWIDGAAAPKTVQVTSNVAWNVEWVSGSDKFFKNKDSGNNNESIIIHPAAAGTGDATNTGRLRVYNSEYGLEAFIDLRQYDWQHGPGGLEREIVSFYIDPADATVNYGTPQEYRVMVHWRDRRNGGSWTNHYSTVYGHSSTGVAWSVSGGGTFSVASNGIGTLTNTNSGSSPIRATVTATLGPGSSIYITEDGFPVLYGVCQLANAGVTVTTGVTLQPQDLVITYGDFTVTLDDNQIDHHGTTHAKASVKKYVNGSFDSDVDVTGDVSFTVTGGPATISGTTVTGANDTYSDATVTVRGEYGGSLTLSGATTATASLTVKGRPEPVTTYEYKLVTTASQTSLQVPGPYNLSGSVSTSFLFGKLYKRTLVDGVQTVGWTEEADVTSSGFSATAGSSCISISGSSATALGAGTATIRSRYQGQSISEYEDAEIFLAEARLPVSLSFDQTHYDLVRVSGGEVLLSHAFTLTVQFNDGSSQDVTSSATYNDQGSVEVDAAAGELVARAACSSKTVTGSFGGLTAAATYSATDLEIPADLKMKHFESQEDQNREFLITDFEATLRKVLSGTTRKDTVTAEVQIDGIEGDIVRDTTGPFTFHFTAAGSGTIRFSFTLNGILLVRTLTVTCSNNHHITYTWN
ncbi:MAG: DUF4906 domain-containing protein [Bacteroidales bacterium]|nr:DUF4906 domain-containing protein [Bacteroidales bacterium]